MSAGRVDTLRASRNGISCVADDPSDDRFDVRCYRDEFWSVIRRARRLYRSGQTGEQVDDEIRRKLEAGELLMPTTLTAGYRMLGPISAYDRQSRTVGPEIARWQSIHFPFHTAAEIGLTEDEEPNEPTLSGLMPYVMAAGTWWSHLMIVHEPCD